MISFIIPSRNNLPYLKLAYGSIRKFYPTEEIIILDDNSSDDSYGWMCGLNDRNLKTYVNSKNQIGHTVLYDVGVIMSTNEIFTIFHADMVCGPNYVENIMKWLKPNTVVSATRIEPPLHPAGKEKIVKNFGLYFDEFKEKEFEEFCTEEAAKNSNIITNGIFAPWAMYKKDFLAIGGHDKYFAPFPYEDSDIFQRFILAGYDVIQSRDAFVYHFTCRGHRWTKEINKDDNFYKLCCAKNQAYFIRKWGSWIENDEFSKPIITPKYDISFVVKNCNKEMLGLLEPWCSRIFTDCVELVSYIEMVQPGTPFNMTSRVLSSIYDYPNFFNNGIVVSFDARDMNNERFGFLTKLPKILKDSGEIGKMEYDIFTIEIAKLEPIEKNLVTNSAFHMTLDENTNDPYCTDELFRVYKQFK